MKEMRKQLRNPKIKCNHDKLEKKLIRTIEKEIQWSLEHPANNLPKSFQEGFVTGLQQSIYLIKNLKE